MTSFIPPTNQRSRRGGFTLVEMLVVIGIIIALVGILLPAIAIGYKHAVKVRMGLDIQTIVTALESYRNDMRDYPAIDYNDANLLGASPPTTGAAYPGSVVLCRALIAPGTNADDGAGTPDATGSETGAPAGQTPVPTKQEPGPGFRLLPGGKVYGPYLDPGRFKMVQDPQLAGVATSLTVNGTTVVDPHYCYLADRYGHPILYFRANQAADIHNTTFAGFCAAWNKSMPASQRPYYNLNDGCGNSNYPALWWAGTSESSNSVALSRMRLMLGDKNMNGRIDNLGSPPETPVTTAPYLVWSAGPDEVFGIDMYDSNNTLITNISLLNTRVPNSDDAVSWPH